MKKEKIVIYSTPTCHYCAEAKEFLKKFGIKFTSIDVAKDLKARKEMMAKTQQMGVPVITVGEEAMVGFGSEVKDKLVELLDIKINK